MSRPPVAVVLATHGRPALLAASLPALAADLRNGDELVVVESGGTGAAEVVAGLDTRAVARHLSSDHRGKSHKLNRGIEATRCPLVLLTDDDCAVEPGWVDAMAGAFDDHGVGVAFGPVAGLTSVPGGSGPPSVAPGEAPWATWTYAHGAAMAVRREAVVAAGGFDERLGPGAPAHGEEHDLLLRLREAGWRAVVVEAPPVGHLAWRDETAERRNLFVYERGAGAFLGAAVRRDRRAGWSLLRARLSYLRALWGDAATRGRTFGPRATIAFARGLAYGLRLRPARWLDAT